MFKHFGEEDHDGNEDFIEGEKYERRTILDKIRDAAATEKKSAMGVFKIQAADSNDEVNIWMVKIPKTKDTVFQLVPHYVVFDTTFWMKAKLIGAVYDIIDNP